METELRPIKSIVVKSESEPVYNFTTDTHTYCLSDGLVVHNCDTISMLASLNPWKPTSYVDMKQSSDTLSIWELDIEEDSNCMSSYIV